MVIFSIERLIVVYYPIGSRRLLSSTKYKLIINLTILFGLIFYSPNLFTSGLEAAYSSYNNNKTQCVPLKDWINFVEFMTLVDIVLTMLIPFILIAFINFLIILKLTDFHFYQRHNNKIISIGFKRRSTSGSNLSRRGTTMIIESNRNIRRKTYSRTTNILLSISIAFLLFHCPIALCKINILWNSTTGSNFEATLNNDSFSLNSTMDNLNLNSNQTNMTQLLGNNVYMNDATNDQIFINQSPNLKENLVQHLIDKFSNDLYYLNFVLNFFFYSLNAKNYRQMLCVFFKKPLNSMGK